MSMLPRCDQHVHYSKGLCPHCDKGRLKETPHPPAPEPMDEVEVQRLQLAACLMAAEGSGQPALLKQGDAAWCLAVDRILELREELEEWKQLAKDYQEFLNDQKRGARALHDRFTALWLGPGVPADRVVIEPPFPPGIQYDGKPDALVDLARE